MTLRFHESVPALVRLAMAHGVPIDLQTVVVRDGAGRLILARESIANAVQLEAALQEGLGGYAGPLALVTGAAVQRLLSDPSLVEVETVDAAGAAYRFKYADRRIVGMDWLRVPVPLKSQPKRLVFGSIKGGVGRSTALAVLAADLARAGKRVLAIDLDIEAPGIGSMLLPGSSDLSQDRRPRFGVVDYLVEDALGGIKDEELYDFVGVSPFHEGSIDVVPAAGRVIDDRPETMIAKLSRALVEDRESDRTVSVTEQVSRMVDRFAERTAYDAILIDARAGMAEITAAPLIGLGAHILFFGIDQPQTFRGYSYILSQLVSISDFTSLTELTDWRLRLSFIQAKAPSAATKRASFRDRLFDLCANQIYDEEELVPGKFAPGQDEKGNDVPHDAWHIQFHPEYEAFDPLGDTTQLDPDVYKGPFGAFLERAWDLLNIEHEAGS